MWVHMEAVVTCRDVSIKYSRYIEEKTLYIVYSSLLIRYGQKRSSRSRYLCLVKIAPHAKTTDSVQVSNIVKNVRCLTSPNTASGIKSDTHRAGLGCGVFAEWGTRDTAVELSPAAPEL